MLSFSFRSCGTPSVEGQGPTACRSVRCTPGPHGRVNAVHLSRGHTGQDVGIEDRGMAQTEQKMERGRRARLNRDRVLRAAVELADEAGIDSVSMRNLAERLGVVPMALYKHVANKDELLDGMVDVIVGEIDQPGRDTDWKSAVRARILSARRALLRHPWAPQVIESRTTRTPVVLEYMNSVIGMFRAGGFSVDLTHHVMHAIGRRMWGFTQELLPDSDGVHPAAQATMISAMPRSWLVWRSCSSSAVAPCRGCWAESRAQAHESCPRSACWPYRSASRWGPPCCSTCRSRWARSSPAW